MSIDKRRILYIGVPNPQPPVRSGSLFDETNLNEFVLICWFAPTLLNFIPRGFANTPTTGEQYKQFLARYLYRMQDILEWVSNGHVLLIVEYSHLRVDYEENGLSVQDDLIDLPPFNEVKLTPHSGELIAPIEQFSREFSSFTPLLRYEYIVQGEEIIPLFTTSTTRREHSQIVGGIVRKGNGAIVFSPPAKNWNDSGLLAYFEAIARVPELLGPALKIVPGWTDAFQSKAEREGLGRISEINREIAALEQRRGKELELVEEETQLKCLYSGHDNSLVETAEKALRELDLRVVRGPHPRADLLIWDGGERLAACEVKGLKGTAREHNLRQMERWVADVKSTLVDQI
jgi:hypothetical protein